MRNFPIWSLLIPGCVAVAAGTQPKDVTRFTYDQATGTCAGLNKLDPAALFVPDEAGGKVYTGKDASCVDFKSFDFQKQIGASWPELRGWDFRGADFAGASVHFTKVLDAKFEGASMEPMKLGYIEIEGSVDAHTKPPLKGYCHVNAGRLKCAI